MVKVIYVNLLVDYVKIKKAFLYNDSAGIISEYTLSKDGEITDELDYLFESISNLGNDVLFEIVNKRLFLSEEEYKTVNKDISKWEKYLFNY